jgi:hypothetical protein
VIVRAVDQPLIVAGVGIHWTGDPYTEAQPGAGVSTAGSVASSTSSKPPNR